MSWEAAPAVLLLVLLAGLNIFAAVDIARGIARTWNRWIERRRNAAAEIEVVAQAIASCYGHGPLAVMDPAYQIEFRRDARAAIEAMGKQR